MTLRERMLTMAGQRRKVLVLLGGTSAEREVSLRTGEQVSRALAAAGHEVSQLDTAAADFISEITRIKPCVVFICLHGRLGEDGTVQGLLELLGIPYVGSGVLASALAMDKVMSKHFFSQAGIPSPRYAVVFKGDEPRVEEITQLLGSKTVVKPANEGSAIGVSISHDPDELNEAIDHALLYDNKALVEEFVAGVEITVGVLGNEDAVALPTIELVPATEFQDYEAKYAPGMSTHIIPARISDSARAKAEEIALKAHSALECRGMSRADMIVGDNDTVYLLETNTIPGMTQISLLPKAANAIGLDLAGLCSLLVELALESNRSRHRNEPLPAG